MKTPEENSAKETRESVLQSHCPSMDRLFLDKDGLLFRDRITKAMQEFAAQEVEKATEELREALKELIPIAELEFGRVNNCFDYDNYKAIIDRAKKLIK